MNILIPHSWLKEYLETNAAPKKIAECISLCGASVEKTEKTENDFIYDIEVTTNRVDIMSILGIAREVAAILPQFGIKARLKKDPTLKRSDLFLKGRTLMENKLKVIIKDKKLCSRFTAVILDNIQIKPSPKIIQNRLKKANMRPLNNIIDISNYLMHELGQPVHTFDYDKIAEKTMILRESKKGERLVTLDGKKHILPGNDIIIEDGNKKLIDLCGIMGAENSCIDKKTKKVLLFVQNYEPYHIRKTSMSLGLRTQAASLFEKKIDPELVMPALLKGIQLIGKYAGGKVSSKIIDIYPKPYKPKRIKVSLQLIKQYLNIPIQSNKVIKILNSLGFKSSIINHQSLIIKVKVPSWRANDISIPEDLIEEIARIYGYHNLPSLIIDTPIPTNYPKENFDLEYKIKTYLAGMGLTELYTNSLISRKLAKDSKKEINQHLKIKNALSEEWLYLRRSLIPSHLNAIKNNSNQKHLQFFEMANVYHPEKRKLPKEELQLIISSTQDFLKVKGWLELLLKKLHISASFIPKEILLLKNNKSAEILIGKEVIGKIGSANLPQNYPYKEVNFIIIKIKKLFKFAEKYPQYQAIPKYPPIIEDLSFVIGPEVYYSGIVQLIKSISSIIQSIKLIDSYLPSNSEGKNSLTVRITYQNPKRNLTNKEVRKIRKKIILKLKKQNIILKGKS